MTLAPSSSSPGWNFSQPGWTDKLKNGESLLPDFPLDAEKAAIAVGIYNKLRLPDVIGQPALADAGAEWQRDMVRALHGSLIDGRRLVREIMCLVPKKNSKTTTGGALMLTSMLCGGRHNAEYYIIGPTQTIAETAFNQVVGMINADPDGVLQQRLKITASTKEIKDLVTGNVLKIMTLDMNVLTGKKPAGVLVDELHRLGEKRSASSIIDQIRGNFVMDRTAFLLFITTQSVDPPAGAFKYELQKARAIRDGRYEGKAEMLPMLYEFPEQMQRDKAKPWLKPENWPMVTPNLGLSVDIDALSQIINEAKVAGEEKLQEVASQHLNIEIGLGLHANRWRGADYWEQAATPELTFDQLLERSEVVVCGLDAGGLDDLFGFCVAGRCKETKNWLYWVHAWADPCVLEKRPQIAPRLLDFEGDGDLTFMDKTSGCINDIISFIKIIDSKGLFPTQEAIALDPAGMGLVIDSLKSEGFEHPLVIGIPPQSYHMQSAIFSMERMLRERSAEHGGQSLFTWCVGNASAELRGSTVSIDKRTAGRAKIDPLIAAFLATKLLENTPSVDRSEPEILLV